MCCMSSYYLCNKMYWQLPLMITAFLPVATGFHPVVVSFDRARSIEPAQPAGLSPLMMAAGGFGGKGMGKKDKASSGASTTSTAAATSKLVKLKPKQQWDRYMDLKAETKIPVGIRIKDDESKNWLGVGHVRSKDGAYTTVSVALQRALIAEHAKRLYPLQVSPKKTLEWGILDEASGEWQVVDKSILDDPTTTLPDGIEKLIGFEGTPDPATGYYCIYDGGKLKLGDESSFK